MKWALWRGFHGIPSLGEPGHRLPGLALSAQGSRSVPCPAQDHSASQVTSASQKGHLAVPGPLTLWQWPHLGPYPYPEAAVSRFEHPSQHLLSASFLAPSSASPPRWPQPPWPWQQVKKQGHLALLDGGISRARLTPASGLPGHLSGPRTGNQLALQTCAGPRGAA